MAIAKYESVMVVSVKEGDEAVQALIEKFKSLIESNAKLHSVDEWGKRKLAYLINKESEGYYVLYNFESEPEFPAELDRVYKITDGVMRSLIVKKPEGEDFTELPKKEEVKEDVKEEVKEDAEAEVAETEEVVEEAAQETVEATEEVAEEAAQETVEATEEVAEAIEEAAEEAAE